LPWDEPFHPVTLAAGIAIYRISMDMIAASSSSKELPSRNPRIGGARFARTDALGGYMALAGSRFETRLPPHVHSSYVLGVVEDGGVRITTNESSYVATAGMVVLLSPFVVHTEIPVGEQGWTFRYLYPTDAVVREALNLAAAAAPALRFSRPVVDDPALASLITRVHRDMEAGAGEGATADSLISLVRRLEERFGRHESVGDHPARERRNIGAVRDLITERPLRGVKLQDLADAAGLSPFHFTRVFKNEIGLPPYAYYEQVRIAFAHQLIHQGQDLTSVAYQLGYADQSHLTRHFRRGSFTTPGKMAQLARHASAYGR
jgi:AraC-like DNA-binding protein